MRPTIVTLIVTPTVVHYSSLNWSFTMTLHSFSVSAIATAALLLAASAHAHDLTLHDDYVPPVAKAKPITCDQLADNEHYSNNMGDADTKALKAKRDAEKKTAAEPVPRKTS